MVSMEGIHIVCMILQLSFNGTTGEATTRHIFMTSDLKSEGQLI